VIAWLPLAVELFRPFPFTETEVAFVLDHVMVVEPGAVALAGLAEIDALTEEGAATAIVCEIVGDVAPAPSTA